jgi:hypothetical protein
MIETNFGLEWAVPSLSGITEIPRMAGGSRARYLEHTTIPNPT